MVVYCPPDQIGPKNMNQVFILSSLIGILLPVSLYLLFLVGSQTSDPKRVQVARVLSRFSKILKK